MELKVWVDGIQRVVCGASYSTTCQDVVIALASAMGRTGRFTLVEKWRDSERPLFPNEFPLQSLHKWGEYAGEIRFYLVQAETDKVKQQEVSQQKRKAKKETFSNFTHNFNPPQSSQHHIKQSEVESLKRSSTFSCAQRTNYAALPSSSLVQKTSALPQYTSDKQTSVPASISSRGQPLDYLPMSNGKVSKLSSASSSDSSSRSSSTSLGQFPQSNISRGQSSVIHPIIPTWSGDARELHPANMPEVLSSYSAHAEDFNPSSSHKQYSSSQPALVPSQQVHPSTQHLDHRQTSKTLTSSSKLAYQTTTKFHNSPATPSLQSCNLQPQLQMSTPQSYPEIGQSWQVYPQRGQSQQRKPRSEQTHRYPQSDQSQQQYIERDQSPQRFTEKNQSQHPFSHNGQSQQIHHTKPATQFQHTSYVDYRNLPTNPKQQQEQSQSRERPRYRNSHANKSGPNSADLQDASRTYLNKDNKARPTQKPLVDAFINYHDDDNVFDDDGDEATRRNQNVDREGIPQNNLNIYTSGNQERSRSRDNLEAQYEKRVTTLDRRITRSKVNMELPSRSLSTGEQGDEQVRSLHERHQNNLLSELDPHKQVAGGNKLTFVDSAAMRHQKSSAGGSTTQTSFTSAVSFLRKHGDTDVKTSKTETNIKQLASLTSNEHDPLEREALIPSQGTRHSLAKSNNVINGHNSQHQNNHQQMQFSAKPPLPLNPIFSSRHNSAFTEVSPKSSHQELPSSVSPASVAYNLDGLSASINNHEKQDGQTSLEFEEYDLDQSFPDILQRDVPSVGVTTGDKRSSLFLEQNLEHGITASHTERERMHLLKTVYEQQEKLKTQEIQIKDVSLEITALEDRASDEMAELNVLSAEISQLEKQDAELKIELEDLEKTQWITVVDEEEKKEADIRHQVKSLKEKQEHLEAQLTHLSKEADGQSKEIKSEEERIIEEKKSNEELERKTLLEIAQVKEQLANLNQIIDEKNKKLNEIQAKILETDADMSLKMDKLKYLEQEQSDEKPEGLLTSLLSKEASYDSLTVTDSLLPDPVNALSTQDNGEAILKILEGQLSPYSSTFPTGDGGDGQSGAASAQHKYKSAMAVKNPNGVWV